MQIKLVEIHDNGITIRAVAVKFEPGSADEYASLIIQSGFHADGSTVLLVELDSERATTDPNRWASMGIHPRTLPVAHIWLERNWTRLPDGMLTQIDVGAILEAKLDPNYRGNGA